MFDRRLVTALVLAMLALPPAAVAQAPAVHIRLAGAFVMTGRVTAARGVAGEYVGEAVTRTWNFLAPCPAGQCVTEELVRSRLVGGDKTLLHRPPAVFSRWTGEGSFFAPLLCGSQLDPLGERVFFKITVQITGAVLVGGVPVASTVKATYQSYRRANRTRCVFAAGHDAAVYTGTLVPPTPTPVTTPPAPTPAPG